MIFSENRFPLFGIMLWATLLGKISLAFGVRIIEQGKRGFGAVNQIQINPGRGGFSCGAACRV
jgi:hypothetical protein